MCIALLISVMLKLAVLRVVGAHPIAGKRLSSKGNAQGAGRPVKPVLRDIHFPVSVLSFQAKAKKLIQPHNSSFSASRGWVTKFFAQHKLALHARTSISQKLPRQLEGVLTKFSKDAAKFMRIDKYPLSVVGNRDETTAFFDMVQSKCIAEKGDKECDVRSSRSEKKHLTVVLSATADGKMLPPMIIFKGKTDRTICNLNIPINFVVKTQEKTWTNDDLMQVWVEYI